MLSGLFCCHLTACTGGWDRGVVRGCQRVLGAKITRVDTGVSNDNGTPRGAAGPHTPKLDTGVLWR